MNALLKSISCEKKKKKSIKKNNIRTTAEIILTSISVNLITALIVKDQAQPRVIGWFTRVGNLALLHYGKLGLRKMEIKLPSPLVVVSL